MEMTVDTLEGGVRCVRLVGRLDLKGTQEIEASFGAETGALKKSVIVDMSKVDFIASIGIRLLLSNIKLLNPAGAKMVLSGSQKLVDDVLKLSGLDAVATIVADEGEALKMLSAG